METIPRQIFYVHSAYIVALVSAMAVACFVFTAEFIEGGESTARGLVLFMAVFWLSRLVIQLTYYDKAARRERPFLNALFAAGFGYFAALFGALPCGTSGSGNMLEPIANLSFAPGGSGWAILLRLAGAVSLAIAIGSLAILAPSCNGARNCAATARSSAKSSTYAGYIFIAHVCFGVLLAYRPAVDPRRRTARASGLRLHRRVVGRALFFSLLTLTEPIAAGTARQGGRIRPRRRLRRACCDLRRGGGHRVLKSDVLPCSRPESAGDRLLAFGGRRAGGLAGARSASRGHRLGGVLARDGCRRAPRWLKPWSRADARVGLGLSHRDESGMLCGGIDRADAEPLPLFQFPLARDAPGSFRCRRRPFRPDWQPPISARSGGICAGRRGALSSSGFAGYAAEATLLAGFSLALHFGILSVMSGVWRASGFPAYALFRDPWKAATLGEFWARRWNVGFAEMAAVAVARPLRRTRRHRLAIPAAFLFSGLAHEIAITVPARGGYGGPLAYFLLHGALVWIEPRVSLPSWMHRLLLFAALVFPLPLLFPSAFIDAALRPLLP
ncbi:MAG: MBOAT family protein [Verrucomicrobiales bacterium]